MSIIILEDKMILQGCLTGSGGLRSYVTKEVEVNIPNVAQKENNSSIINLPIYF